MRVALCAIFKNEGKYIKEWIAYHLALGFDAIHLYDNGSTDDSLSIIENAYLNGVLNVKPWPGHPVQLLAYKDFIETQRNNFEWVLFIDLDEFLVLFDDDSIHDFVKDYTGFSAVLINWLNFGPHNHITRPDSFVIETYFTRFPAENEVNRHVKSMVCLKDCLGISENPHVFETVGPQCTTMKEKVTPSGWQPFAEHKRAAINHYFTRSEQDWVEKVSRGRATTNSRYSPDEIENIRIETNVYDGRILRWRSKFRACLSLIGE